MGITLVIVFATALIIWAVVLQRRCDEAYKRYTEAQVAYYNALNEVIAQTAREVEEIKQFLVI